jgi:elongation factor P
MYASPTWFDHWRTAREYCKDTPIRSPESAIVGTKENEEYKALRLDGRLLDIVLPPQIPLKVVNTAPASRTGSTTSWKEAKLETGLQIMVPLFIANGDIIRVDTAGKKYLGKE